MLFLVKICLSSTFGLAPKKEYVMHDEDIFLRCKLHSKKLHRPFLGRKMKICIVSGTNRKGSMSLKIAEKMQKQYEEHGAEVVLIDLSRLPPSCFSPTIYQEKPKDLDPFLAPILQADGVLFIVAEYNGSFPGILKYYIDMWKYPESFEGRKVAYVGVSAGIWGGLRAVEHLQGVMGYRNAWQYPKRIFINNIYQRWDYPTSTLKKLTEKEYDIEQLLLEQTQGFLGFIQCDIR